MIALKEITTEEMLIECLDLSVSSEQELLVNTTAESLALAWFNRDSAKPFCIYSGDVMVGFLMLNCIDQEKTCEIWQLLIDKNHQKQGYGKAAVIAAIDYFKSNKIYEKLIVLAFPHNKTAIAIYESCGFSITGEIVENEVVMEFDDSK